MRIALLVVASLVAACRDGIEIEILADETTTTVEVFVATHAATPDTAFAAITRLGPENSDRAAPLVAGTLFPRDLGLDGAVEPPFTASVGGDGRARLELRSDGEHTSVAALIAVGYDVEGGITSAAVLLDVDVSAEPVRAILELAPVTRATLDGLPSAAQVWAGADDRAGCVGVTTAEGDTTFIVAEADPDCDGFTLDAATAPDGATDVECDPLDHRGRTDATPSGLSDATGTCHPSVSACVDGEGARTRPETALCLPDALCTLPCASAGLGACEAELQEPLLFAHLVCTVPYLANSTSLEPSQLCGGQPPAPSTLATLFDGSVACDEVSFASITVARSGVTLGNFEPRLALGVASATSSTSIEAGVVMSQPPPGMGGCTFALTPLANLVEDRAIDVRQVARIHTTDDKVLMLPVKVKPVMRSQCTAEDRIACTYERADGGGGTTPDGIEACAP